jgi:hypothetical protein
MAIKDAKKSQKSQSDVKINLGRKRLKCIGQLILFPFIFLLFP